MAHVILFEHAVFRGAHKHVFDNTAGILKGNGDDGEWNLNNEGDDDLQESEDNFNDRGTQSLVVLEGTWEFFEDWKYGKKMGELGPGRYPYVIEALGKNNALSSLRPVESESVKSKRVKSKRGVKQAAAMMNVGAS